MQLAHVEGFVEVARRGNLSRAAEALYLTQPALTARLRTLEEELGAPLFVRGRRGMTLTDTGRAFLPYAERALASLRDGSVLVGELVQGGTGELALGAAPAVSTYVLPSLLVRFAARYPRVRLVVRTGHSEEILEMAIRGEIAVGLTREIRHPLIESRPLYDDELVLVTDPEHPLAAARSVGPDRLREARLILFDRTSSYYELTNALFREAGVVPSGVMELDNIDAAKQMVEAGLGIALLPLTAVARELATGELRALTLEGSRPMRRRIVAIRRADAPPPTGVLAGFWAVLDGIAEVLPNRDGSMLA
jgi:DNA-binding transcriptional LysR family regulator